MQRVVFRPQAQAELQQARDWYEDRLAGLGLAFACAVEAAIDRVVHMPFAFGFIEADFRHIVMRRFPYSIIYFTTDTEIVIVSCFHHRRRPLAWVGNVGRR